MRTAGIASRFAALPIRRVDRRAPPAILRALHAPADFLARLHASARLFFCHAPASTRAVAVAPAAPSACTLHAPAHVCEHRQSDLKRTYSVRVLALVARR